MCIEIELLVAIEHQNLNIVNMLMNIAKYFQCMQGEDGFLCPK